MGLENLSISIVYSKFKQACLLFSHDYNRTEKSLTGLQMKLCLPMSNQQWKWVVVLEYYLNF